MALPDGFVDLANQRYIEAKRFWGNWRGSARNWYAFVSGDQWMADDLTLLKEQKRPAITFNYSEKMIDAVVGAEVSGRQEIMYAPRSLADAPLAELETNAVRWVRDLANTNDEESDSFRDTLICGLGWTFTKVSYEEDPDGMLVTDRVDPLEMLSDPTARKGSLTDRRYCFREMWVDERWAKKQWPSSFLLSLATDTSGQGVDVIRHGHGYEDENQDDADSHKGQILVRHYECVELVPYYKVQGEQGHVDVDPSSFAKMKDELDKKNIKYVQMNKRVYYIAFFNDEKLLEGDLSPTQIGFCYQCITGKRDRNANTWYGLTKVMEDPQRWANKWLSQILHIINSNAKGGLLAEINAFVDPARAQDEYAKPESITLLTEGGLTKVREKMMVNYPSGLDKLMEFALASLPQVTGINLEALGLAGREQANVLEQSRKQAAYGLLAPVFDSLRRYRKIQGRVLLDFINTYISDGRMVRIGGAESQQFLPLRRVPDAAKFDIIVDQSPSAPDIKRETWSVLEVLIPAAMKAGLPIPPTILKYAPIPTALALEWQQYVQQSQGQASPQAMQQLQQQLAQATQDNQKLKQQLADKSQELQMKFQEMQQTMHNDMAALRAELAIKEQESSGRMALMQQQANHAAQITELQTHVGLSQAQQRTDAAVQATMQKAANPPKSKE